MPLEDPTLNQGQLSYSHNDIVENFIVIQLIFAEIFVPQYFTIRTIPGLSGPTNTCGVSLHYFNLIQNSKT